MATLAALAVGLTLYSQAWDRNRAEMPAAVAIRILLGVGDKQPQAWDGGIRVSPGTIYNIEGWRFRKGIDSTDGRSSWKCASGFSFTHNASTLSPVLENGVVVSVVADDPRAKFEVTTKQGNFSFAAGEISYGIEKRFLGGAVTVDRVPATVQLTSSLEDEDFPAIAQREDTVYMAFVQFVRGDRSQARWNNMGKNPPKSFDFVSRPVGGDQVFLMRYSKSKRTWSEPEPVSSPKQDVMRTAVAVDGQKRVWVFWSANQNGNFDIYAKSFSGGKWSSEMRLTTDAGTDVNPVAATDVGGRVWLAWQGFRNGNLDILASVQDGDRFMPETTVSFSRANDWILPSPRRRTAKWRLPGTRMTRATTTFTSAS